MKCNPQAVIKVAEAEIGYKEKATNSQLYDKDANVGRNNWNKYANDIDTKYPDFYNGKKNGYDWCDVFVDWCFIQAYGRENAQRLLCQPNHSLGAGCEYSYNYFKEKGQTGSAPKLGAQIFFGDLDHTGIVVDFDSSTVWTVEGNTGADVNEVCRKKYSRNSSWIYGYGYPKFDEETPTPEPVPSGNTWTGKYPNLPSRGYFLTGDGYERYKNMQADIKLIQEYLNWAICAGLEVDGFYGERTTEAVGKFQKKAGIKVDGSYGKETLAAARSFTKSAEPTGNVVKASEGASSFNEYLKGTYKVDSRSGLNIRDGAGTNYKVLTAIPYGQEVTCYGYYTRVGTVDWYYIETKYNGTTYIGFVSSAWLS